MDSDILAAVEEEDSDSSPDDNWEDETKLVGTHYAEDKELDRVDDNEGKDVKKAVIFDENLQYIEPKKGDHLDSVGGGHSQIKTKTTDSLDGTSVNSTGSDPITAVKSTWSTLATSIGEFNPKVPKRLKKFRKLVYKNIAELSHSGKTENAPNQTTQNEEKSKPEASKIAPLPDDSVASDNIYETIEKDFESEDEDSGEPCPLAPDDVAAIEDDSDSDGDDNMVDTAASLIENFYLTSSFVSYTDAEGVAANPDDEDQVNNVVTKYDDMPQKFTSDEVEFVDSSDLSENEHTITSDVSKVHDDSVIVTESGKMPKDFANDGGASISTAEAIASDLSQNESAIAIEVNTVENSVAPTVPDVIASSSQNSDSQSIKEDTKTFIVDDPNGSEVGESCGEQDTNENPSHSSSKIAMPIRSGGPNKTLTKTTNFTKISSSTKMSNPAKLATSSKTGAVAPRISPGKTSPVVRSGAPKSVPSTNTSTGSRIGTKATAATTKSVTKTETSISVKTSIPSKTLTSVKTLTSAKTLSSSKTSTLAKTMAKSSTSASTSASPKTASSTAGKVAAKDSIGSPTETESANVLKGDWSNPATARKEINVPTRENSRQQSQPVNGFTPWLGTS